MPSKKKKKKYKRKRGPPKYNPRNTGNVSDTTSKFSAETPDPVKAPRNRDKAVSAAYLRLLGASQDKAATEAGCAVRQLSDWEKCSWWPEILAEARQRWLQGGDSLAMRSCLRAFTDQNEYAQHSRWWADRRIPELRPPKQRQEVTGEDGGPVQLSWAALVKKYHEDKET